MIGARRFTSSARSISSGVKSSSVAGRRQRGVRDEDVDVAGTPRPDARRRRGRRGRPRARGRPSSAASGSSTSARRPVRTSCAPRSAQRAGDRLADAAAGAREQDGSSCDSIMAAVCHRARGQAPPRRWPGVRRTRATVAVKPCRKFSPPTGPISPAAKKPADGAPPSCSSTRVGVVVGDAEHPSSAAVAGEHERAGGRAAERGRAQPQRSLAGRGRRRRRRARAGARTWPSADGRRDR